jgi:hypothetical protein
LRKCVFPLEKFYKAQPDPRVLKKLDERNGRNQEKIRIALPKFSPRRAVMESYSDVRPESSKLLRQSHEHQERKELLTSVPSCRSVAPEQNFHEWLSRLIRSCSKVVSHVGRERWISTSRPSVVLPLERGLRSMFGA